jgi:predicted nucleic acid-binding protein
MISSSSLVSNGAVLVLDASVVINLNATARAVDIIRGLPHQFVVTNNAIAELAAGRNSGHDDARKLQALIDSGLVTAQEVGDEGIHIYESLVEGSTVGTLDDGEAATIAYAAEVGAVAVIDERKARKICKLCFPQLAVLSTVDLLLHGSLELSLGSQGQSDAIFDALRVGRMRVIPERLEMVVGIIGVERASVCQSLPRNYR